MSSGIEQHIDWAVAAKIRTDRAGAGGLAAQANAPSAEATRRNVMDTLLGANKLTAMDISGGDPYNATGRHFRR